MSSTDRRTDRRTDGRTRWIQYTPPPTSLGGGIIKDIYCELETQIKQKTKENEIILGGDFNARLEIKNEVGNQTENSNGKKLQRIIDNNSLIPISTKAHYGLWTRVNRNNTEERSVIDYIITTETIERNTTSLIIDKEGTLRIKGKKESDHNTILMAIKVNNPRKREYITKWKLENKEGWNQFNKKIKEENNQSELSKRDYEDTERTIIKTMEETVGRQKTRVDKPPPHQTKSKQQKTLGKLRKKNSKGPVAVEHSRKKKKLRSHTWEPRK